MRPSDVGRSCARRIPCVTCLVVFVCLSMSMRLPSTAARAELRSRERGIPGRRREYESESL